MGFWDSFFNMIRHRNSNLSLPEGQRNEQIEQNANQIENEEVEKVDIRIFSRKKDDNIIYSLNMNSSDGVIPIGKVYCKEDSERKKSDTLALKEITRQVQDAMGSLINADNEASLEIAKKATKYKLEKISTEYLQFNLTNEAVEYIDNYMCKSEEITYEQLKDLPKTIDMKKISEVELLKIGEMLLGRLNTLNSIKTPEDAYADKESLISFMLQKEDVPTNPIVDANIQSVENGVHLDEETVIKIAKGMEQIENEDGALYSAYLKLEEKRILKRMQKTFTEYSNPNNTTITQERYEIFSYLEKQIKDIKGGFSPQVLEFIINSMKEIDIEIYTKQYKQKDKELAAMINQQYPNIKDKDEMLRYLYARIGTLGQLYYKGNSGNRMVLRNFVANTEFKDPDNTESKEFLFVVAQTEKEYIKTEYNQILQEYAQMKSKLTEEKTFKERMAVDLKNASVPMSEKYSTQKYASKEQQDFEIED